MKEEITVDNVEYIRKDSIKSQLLSEEDYENNPHWPWIIGAAYMIRTVTFHDHGTIVGVTAQEIVLKKAAWIPDSGRWWNFITGKAKPNEVEPFAEESLVIIGRGAIVDATQLTDSFGVQK